MRRLVILVLLFALVATACSSDDADSTGDTGTAEDLTFPDPTVTYLQDALSQAGYDVTVDGLYGPTTQSAISEFQTDSGLEPTGFVTVATLQALAAISDDVEHLLIEAIQTQLAELGYYTGLIDGLWGSGTDAAVLALQEDLDLEPTGTFDDETLRTMIDTYNERVIAEHVAASGSEANAVRTTIPAGAEADYLQRGDEGPEILELQRRLAELGYRPGTPDGTFGAQTASAVLAFQKREGLLRDAIVGPEVLSRLENPQGAGPRSDAPGPRVEVDLDRQVLFAIAADGSVTTLSTSTGSGREFQSAEPGKGIVVAHTPVGEFEILRVIDGLREAPLGTLYRPMYFTAEGGFAIHGNPHVPGYPASHGCARLANYDMDYLWDIGLVVGDPVWVYGENPPAPPNAAAGF